MSRVITFSRTFPSYHPRAGEPTYFVEQLQNSLCSMNLPLYGGKENCPLWFLESLTKENVGYKHHTIRAGHRFKVGDWVSPRVWLLPGGRFTKGNKQIIIAPDIQIKKIWDFEVYSMRYYESIYLNKTLLHRMNELDVFIGGHAILKEIAKNDGLEYDDFTEWFKLGRSIDFDGQIICWNEKIEY